MPRTGKSRNVRRTKPSPRYEPAKIDALFTVLDAIAWIDAPSSAEIAQFAGIDPRTAGKLLKNATQIGLVDRIGDRQYKLILPYPYKGSIDQKKAVVREALVRLPLLTSVRQFLRLGDSVAISLRKAATIHGVVPLNETDFKPLLEWAEALRVLDGLLLPEDLLADAAKAKEDRHRVDSDKRVAFLSHSFKDKPFIRQLASDLAAQGIGVWLDEQRIRVGDSIPERIAQGLAESDFFLIAVSENSVGSEWVKKELNSALVSEVERRQVRILPLKLDDTPLPEIIKDKKYADFSQSYRSGLNNLVQAMKETTNGWPD